MNMKKIIASGSMLISLFVSGIVSANQIDICSKIPGHWDGIYTIKNPELCKIYNGCTHLVSVDITYLSGTEYRANLNPAVGEGGEFNLNCVNGVITSPINPGNKITLACNATNHCFVVYNDQNLTSELRKG